MRTFSLGPLTLHVASRPFRFSVLESGKPLLAERVRRDAGSLELLDDGVWRPAVDVLSIDADQLRDRPEPKVIVETSLEGGGRARVEFSWSADGGSLEISFGTATHAGVREDFVTLPDQSLLVFGGPRGDPKRRLALAPRFGLLAGARTADGGPAEAPDIFEPDPDAIRIQATSSSLVLELFPGTPREVIERMAKREEKDVAGRPRLQPLPLVWIDAGSRLAPEDEARLRALASEPVGEGAGILFDEDGKTSFKGPSGEALARGPRSIRVDGWRSLRDAALAAIETSVLAAEPRVVRLPVESVSGGGKPTDLWARSIAMAALQPSVALPADLVAACAAKEPPDPGERGERARVARRLLRARAALRPLLGRAGLAPLFIEYPDEDGAWRARDEWLLGRDILVAPVLEEGKQGRAVYFPAGAWRRLGPAPASGGPPSFRGPGLHPVDIPPGEPGLFAREGGDASLARALAEALGGR